MPLNEIKENDIVQKLLLSVGTMETIKPLVRCFVTFHNLRKLHISYIALSKLHFMAIDNYIVQNNRLKSLKLISVKMTHDHLRLIINALEVQPAVKTIDFSYNSLKNGGAIEISRLLKMKRKNALSKIVLTRTDMREEGLVSILHALRPNKRVVKFIAEDNKFSISRGILALIGNLVAYANNTLQFLQLTCHDKGLLR